MRLAIASLRYNVAAMRTRRLASLLSLVLLLALGLAACAGDDGPIKIGGLYALTGEEAAIDLPSANGARLAVKEINAAGGVPGRQVRLDLWDSKYAKDVAVQGAQKLVNDDRFVTVIGFNDPDSVLWTAPTAQAAGVPFVTSGATSPQLPAQVGDRMFLACFGDNVQAAVGAEFGFKTFGKTAALLWDNGTDYTKLLAGYFKARFTQLGGAIILDDQFADAAKDFSAQITRIKALPRQPDFYFVSAMPYNVGPFVKQFRAAGLTGPVVGGDGYDTPDLIGVAGPAARDVYFTTHALVDSTLGNDAMKRFITAYKAEFGKEPENAFAALGYDSVRLVVDAIKRAGSADPGAIKRALEATRDFPAITGLITLTPESHVPLKGVTVIAEKGGKYTLAAELVPWEVPAP